MKSIVSKHGVSTNNPAGSKLDMKTSSVESRAGDDQRWSSSKNGGYYKQ